MIRTARQQNRKSFVWLQNLVFVRFLSLCFFIFQNLPALFLNLSSIYCLSIEGLSQRFMGSLLAYSQLLEIIGNLFFQRLRLGKVDDGRIDWFLQIDDRLDDIAVARNYRTVEAVQCILRVVIMLINHVWHEDAVYLRVLVEFLQMTVSQFSREADIVAHHRIQGSFILAESGIGRENYAQSGCPEQRIPERIFLVHVEDARNAYPCTVKRGSRWVNCFSIKE